MLKFNPAPQLRLVVYPMIFQGFSTIPTVVGLGISNEPSTGIPNGSCVWPTLSHPEVVPQSPDQSLWSEKGDPGYDWLRQEGRQNTENSKANVRRRPCFSCELTSPKPCKNWWVGKKRWQPQKKMAHIFPFFFLGGGVF